LSGALKATVERRTKGEGSIYYSQSESTWIAEAWMPDGTRKKKRNRDKTIVKAWLAEQQQALKENRAVPDDKITLAALTDRFLKDVAQHTLKPKTYSSYEWILNKHVLPELGKYKLVAIKPFHLQTLYSQKLSEGLSNKTVRHIHATIRRVLNQALKWGLIYRNPCDAVTPPRVERTPPEVWTVEQAQNFLDATKGHRWHAVYLIALTTGARRGEILGMEWENIDWNRHTVRIIKSVSEVNGKAVISDPKTKRARRTVSLPQIVLDALEPLKESSGFIFQTSAGTPVAPRNLLRHFYSVLDTLDVPRIRFHDLRHTAATILFSQDVHPKKVQELLGHSSIVLTLDTYSHIIPSMHSETAEKMDEVFKR
jgi:integrase